MTGRPEEDENYKLAYRQIDEHAVAIGHICIAWASLENTINQLLGLITQLDQQEDATEAITSNIDLRAKIEILKALAFIKKPSEEWFTAVVEVLNEVDNQLRPQRNRNIHEYWLVHYPKRGETTRLGVRTRLRKGSAGSYSLSEIQQTLMKPTDLWDFVHAIRNAGDRIHGLWFDYGKAKCGFGARAHG